MLASTKTPNNFGMIGYAKIATVESDYHLRRGRNNMASNFSLVQQFADRMGYLIAPLSESRRMESGDRYIAHRNMDPVVLTCRFDDRDRGFVIPQELAYVYNTYECFVIVGQVATPESETV